MKIECGQNLLRDGNFHLSLLIPGVCVLQERWRVSAEQAKAESALRGLEEERRTMAQQTGIEREELERAKVCVCVFL